jgi:N-glycosylase/DNA lyase
MLSSVNIESTVLSIYEQLKSNSEKQKIELKNETELWLELIFSILSSRVKYEQVKATFQNLKKSEIISSPKQIISSNTNIKKIESILKMPVTYSYNEKKYFSCFPFSPQRSRYIYQSAKNIYETTSISDLLLKSESANDARKNLMSKCLGLGPKQASMYLNNIGYSHHFAVLDTHILAYLNIIQLLKEKFVSVSNLKKYESIEIMYFNYAKSFSVNLLKLDLAIWVVMRTLKRNFNYEYRNLSLRWT